MFNEAPDENRIYAPEFLERVARRRRDEARQREVHRREARASEIARIYRKGTLRRIRAEVLHKYDIGLRELLSDSHDYRLAQPRHEIYWRAKRETKASLFQIARIVGRSDHTTVISGIRTYERLMRVKAGLEPPTDRDGAYNFDLVIDMEPLDDNWQTLGEAAQSLVNKLASQRKATA